MALASLLRLLALYYSTISLSIHLQITQAASSTTPSTNTPVPPLQWIELTNLISGSPPPGLKYSSIGFDNASNTILIFGGESNGFPEQQTYLLDVASLTWSLPNPAVQTDLKPPARSMAISGDDFAASNRHGHVVIGGKGANGQSLSDAWEFDYISQFWSNITISSVGPSGRFGAAGGIDLTAAPVTDLSVPGPNNTFYLSGGSEDSSLEPLSDLWKFEVAGVLTSNNPTSVVGSWTKLDVDGTLPSAVRLGSAVMPSARVVMSGGCNSETDGDSCAQQDSHVISVSSDSSSFISPAGCPAPRVGPVIVPNFNNFSQSFGSQALMLLGLFNDSQWDDGNGLNQGEVDILTIDTGTWTRVLPAGDPQDGSGSVKFPPPREGAVAYSSASALFGDDASVSSDILVFGGQDINGTYLNDVWLLRSYHASLSQSNANWSGFGDGTLSTGVQASGSGVTIQYLTSCASAIGTAPTSSSTSSPASPTSSASPGDASVGFQFDTSRSHKILSPVSLAVLLPSVLVFRLSNPSRQRHNYRKDLLWSSGLFALVVYVTGIVGIIQAFTTITNTGRSLTKRSSSDTLLKTGHGKAALAFFIMLYALLPILIYMQGRKLKSSNAKNDNPSIAPSRPILVTRKDSEETGFSGPATPGQEKLVKPTRAASSSPDLTSNGAAMESTGQQRRSRTRSLFSGNMWPGLWSKEQQERPSFESTGHESSAGHAPIRSFEVVNRANRIRRISTNGLNGQSTEGGHTLHSAQPSVARSLSDLDWLNRRQNVGACDELDYALSQIHHQHGASTPAGDSGPLLSSQRPVSRPTLPSKAHIVLHTLFHIVLLGLCGATLVALFQRAPKALFIVFLLWVLIFYCTLLAMAWHGLPKDSLLSVILDTLKNHPRDEAIDLPEAQSRASPRPLSVLNEGFPSANGSRSPYTYHQPTFRRALSPHEDDMFSESGQHYEDDEDEATQQRRIEEEMGRREVSIITVPKRKLWIANPS